MACNYHVGLQLIEIIFQSACCGSEEVPKATLLTECTVTYEDRYEVTPKIFS